MLSKLKASLCSLALMLAAAGAPAQDWTGSYPVGIVQMNSTDWYFLRTGGAYWGSAACPQASHIWIRRSDPGTNQLLAAILTARSLGASISAYGTCTENPSALLTTYIISTDRLQPGQALTIRAAGLTRNVLCSGALARKRDCHDVRQIPVRTMLLVFLLFLLAQDRCSRNRQGVINGGSSCHRSATAGAGSR
jgi:hypothetical protein